MGLNPLADISWRDLFLQYIDAENYCLEFRERHSPDTD